MADTKIKSSNITGLAVTHDKLHTDMNLTSKTVQVATPTADAHPATKGYVDTEVANLIDSAPGTLDTLNELAAAIGDDANFAATVTTGLSNKLPLAGGTMTGVIAGFESTGIDDNAANTSVTILSDGKVGIGIESPVRTLDVDSSTSSDIARFGNDSGTYTLGYTTDLASIDLASSAGLRVRSGSTLALQTTSAGFVGIGTVNPNSKLTVSAGSGGTILELNRSNTNTTGTVGAISFTASDGHVVSAINTVGDGDNEGGDLQFRTTSNASGTNYYADTDVRMTIKSDGNVGIGTNDPDAKLDIEGNFESSYALKFTNTMGTGVISGFRSHGTNGESLSLYHDGDRRQVWNANGSVTFENGSGSDQLIIGSTGVTVYQNELQISSSAAYNTHLNYQNTGVNFITTGNSGYTSFRGSSNNITTMTVKGDGKVGIGTSSPQGKLEVSGDVYINGGSKSADAVLVIQAGVAGTDGVTLDTSYYGGGYGPLKLKTGGSERMRINSSGGVGINTNDAIEYMLDVGRDDLAYTSGKTMRINSSGDTIFSLSRQGTSLMSMRNDSTSYTCISSNNSSKLMLGFGTGDAGAINNHLYFTAGETIVNELAQNRDFRVEGTSNSALIFVSASANSVRFGKTTGSNNDAGVMWNHNDYLGITTTSTDSGDRVLLLNRQGGNGDIVEFRTVNSKRGSISSTTSGTTYNTTSDRRLKDNIEPIADATDKLMNMNPVTHTWIDNPEAPQVYGFIAQEMQEVVPEAVSGDAESDEMMSMDYGRITPVIVAALQDALKEIKELKTRIDELENN